MYGLTPDGMEILGFWIAHMESQAEKLTNFIRMYRDMLKGEQ
jgi:hypothetical protein